MCLELLNSQFTVGMLIETDDCRELFLIVVWMEELSWMNEYLEQIGK